MKRFCLGRALIAAAVLAMLGSCATLRRTADQGVVDRVERHLRLGDGEALARMSQVPFLLDGEVVVLPEDIRGFWDAVAAGSWTLSDAALRSGAAVDEVSWRLFAPTQEARAFFRNYGPEGARLLELENDGGERVLVLFHEKPFKRVLLALAIYRGGEVGP